MAISINTSIPVKSGNYLNIDLLAALPNGNHKSATISIDFKDLQPWANIASKEAVDFFFLSAFAYGIDRFIVRRKNSIDGWSRELSVNIPVYNLTKWNACKQQLENLLSFLTGDYWSLSFYKNTLLIQNEDLEEGLEKGFSQVNLFSGGLDSLIGAIDSLEYKNALPILFVSHYDPLMAGPKKDQEDLSENLMKKYGESFIHIPSIKVYLEKSDLPRETTSRSRSLLFLGLALLMAEPNNVDIIVPENGTVSLNYPLSSSRRSACSTRTTHPTLLELVLFLWKELGIKTQMKNPYAFKTKGEMVAECKNKAFLQRVISKSNSCGKRGHRSHWELGTASHCGVCMPCIYRRASLVSLVDRTTYGNLINNLNFKTKKGQDVGACLDFLNKQLSENSIKIELIANGLKDQNNITNYINLIQRTRNELATWIKKFGNEQVLTKSGISNG